MSSYFFISWIVFSSWLTVLYYLMYFTVLLNVFYSVNFEIWPFYEYFNLQVSSFFINSNCCYASIVILCFFWSSLTLSQPSSCLNLLRFLLTERRGPNCILSQTFVILDGRSVLFSTFDACMSLRKHSIEFRELILWRFTTLTNNKPSCSVAMQFELYHFEGFLQITWMIPRLPIMFKWLQP